MKKLFSLGLVFVMGLLLVACQAPKETSEEATKLSTEVVSTYLENLKAGQFKEAEGQLESVPENLAFGDNEVMKQFFGRMVYEIKDGKVSEEETVVTVLIKLPNTALIYDDMMENIGEEVQKLQGGDDTAKTKASGLMVEYLIKKINDSKVVFVENTIDIHVKKVDGKSVIVPSDDLSKTLSGLAIDK